MTMPLDLIDNALRYAREARQEFEQQNFGIVEPLTPTARREQLYLRMREFINIGCRKAVKLLDEPWKRSVAYSILMEACIGIFHYKKTTELMDMYNKRLDEMIGTH